VSVSFTIHIYYSFNDEEGRKALLIFERNICRRTYGPKYKNGEGKSRTNRELEEMRKGENTVK